MGCSIKGFEHGFFSIKHQQTSLSGHETSRSEKKDKRRSEFLRRGGLPERRRAGVYFSLFFEKNYTEILLSSSSIQISLRKFHQQLAQG
jgi:hypothetical protein